MLESVAHGIGLYLIAFMAAAAAWPARRWDGRARAAALAPLMAAGFAAPFFGPEGPVWLRGAVVLQCATTAVKLVDLHSGVDDWRTRRFGEWLFYLACPLVLVYRRYAGRRARPAAESAMLVLRGGLEMIAGGAILSWAFRAELAPFWLDHTVKAVGIYLLVLDGGFVLLTGLARSLGLRVGDQSRQPILAATPAEFWRRYNVEAGRFLHQDVFKPLGGARRPLTGIMIVFLLNGVLHEYLATVMIGRVLGYQVAMFAIFGVATAVTWRWRPTGLARVAGNILTVVFMLVLSVLFFGTAEHFVDWYSGPGPLP